LWPFFTSLVRVRNLDEDNPRNLTQVDTAIRLSGHWIMVRFEYQALRVFEIN